RVGMSACDTGDTPWSALKLPLLDHSTPQYVRSIAKCQGSAQGDGLPFKGRPKTERHGGRSLQDVADHCRERPPCRSGPPDVADLCSERPPCRSGPPA